LFYANKKDKGVLFPEYFSPFLLPGLALILTVVRANQFLKCTTTKSHVLFYIEACIDEWAKGVRVDMAFSQPAYETIYRRHIKDLKWFDMQSKEIRILPNLVKQLNVNGQCVPAILHCNVNLI